MTSDRTGERTDITAEANRYNISVAGQKAGFAEFVDRDGRRIFPHTVVSPEFRGRGLATILVRHALEATRPTGLKVIPQCWMVAEFIEKNPEFADLLDRG